MKKAFFIAALGMIPAHFMAFSAHAIETPAKQAIVVDYTTDTVLYDKNAFDPMFPASMTKMMTAHILMDYIKQGKISLEDELPVSERAWRMGGSKMFVKVGDRVPVKDLLRGIIIQSGNDACVVVAEAISGSEEQFAELMNTYAKTMGLKHSHFKNSTGWPDPEHVVSPHDLYKLARHTIEAFPDFYPIYAERVFTYNGIRQPNRNLLLDGPYGVDGLKTGHTEDAGYGITISGVNEADGRRLIVVVNGLTSEKERAVEAERLLVYGYRNFENKQVFAPGDVVAEAESWYGVSPKVALTVEEPVLLTLPKTKKDAVAIKAVFNDPVPAPVEKGQVMGKLLVSVDGGIAHEIPLVAAEAVEKEGFFAHMLSSLGYMTR